MRNPFLYYSSLLKDQLSLALKKEDPAFWLYENKFRSNLFFMEGLCRLFERASVHKEFGFWRKEFKKLEDELGTVDFFDAYIKEFQSNKKISAGAKAYLKRKREKALTKFRSTLIENKWQEGRVNEFEAFIKNENLKFDSNRTQKLESAMKAELKEAVNFGASFNFNFTEVEEQAHEIRRNVRWISIYSEALRGIVRLKEDGRDYPWKKKYLTKEVLNSAFVKLPEQKNLPAYIEIEKKHFYALSWLINELGILKDQGLKLRVLAKAIRKTEDIDKISAKKKAESVSGLKLNEEQLLKEISKISKTFFVQHKITEGMFIKPVSRAKK
jgi:hypothetical protein